MFDYRMCVAGAVSVAFLLTACGTTPQADEGGGGQAQAETPRAAALAGTPGTPARERGPGAAPAGSEDATARAQRFRRRQDAGDLVAEALAPVDEMIRENGISFRASHFAEDCRDWPEGAYAYYQAHAGRFAFALEVADGRLSEYCLCAARGADGVHGLYVSVCESHVEDEPREGGGVFHRVVIDRIYLVKPDALSLALRAQMLDELSQGNFLGAYRRHLREHPEGAPAEAIITPWLPSGGA